MSPGPSIAATDSEGLFQSSITLNSNCHPGQAAAGSKAGGFNPQLP